MKKHYSSTLLLSGGLDSSILAEIARPTQTVTVIWDDSSPDLRFARRIAIRQKTKHTEVNLNRKVYCSQVLRTVIASLKTFSPIEVRNSVVSCAGLMVAKQLGYEDVMTGDGGDELFVGYKYLGKYFHDLDRLNNEMIRLWNIMQFSSNVLSKTLGICLRTPFLDSQFLSYAKSIPLSKKIGEYSGNYWGKYILRRCFQRELGYDFAWRNKMAQEEGAGTVKLKTQFDNSYDERTFDLRKRLALKERVIISNKEQLGYYEIFRSFYCPPANEDCFDSRCPKCCGCVFSHDSYCKICGSFPIIPVKQH